MSGLLIRIIIAVIKIAVFMTIISANFANGQECDEYYNNCLTTTYDPTTDAPTTDEPTTEAAIQLNVNL
ncbi:hypothetical protein PV328_011521 [Microctonus aethiopoides]|uniref:Uncharacterized protein n=1 Tax=Microctonus aethiopoides TaxID=144406 RepID=A0AA39EYL8_9HYME|nr:hypothetical protein PV328_011521 [Microctonus aethiopoides]